MKPFTAIKKNKKPNVADKYPNNCKVGASKTNCFEIVEVFLPKGSIVAHHI